MLYNMEGEKMSRLTNYKYSGIHFGLNSKWEEEANLMTRKWPKSFHFVGGS